MSRIRTIGRGLFGRNWKNSLASHLINEKGVPLRRNRIEQWDEKDILPDWVIEQAKALFIEREAEFEEAKELISALPVLVKNDN